MGGLIETDKMLLHRETCPVCRAADGDIQQYCEAWSEMYENFIDWQSGEGPWEGHEGWRMCDNCDGAIDPAMGLCPACGYMWCVYDTHECSSSDCDEVELRGASGRRPPLLQGAPMKRIVSYDLDYVRGETCMTKWTEEDGPMPGHLVRCGKQAVAGDTFCCEEHVVGLKALESGEYRMGRMPTAPGGEN